MIEVKKNNFFLNEDVNTCLNNIIKNKSFANGYIFYGAEEFNINANDYPWKYSYRKVFNDKMKSNWYVLCFLSLVTSSVW